MKIAALAAYEPNATLQAFDFDASEIAAFNAIVEVEACGICHSDLHMMDNDWGITRYPIVPGHEVVGRVVELGPDVAHLQVGQRVGLGWTRSACLTCDDCLRGDEQMCSKSKGTITAGRGGFASHVVADSRFLFPIPDGIDKNLAGPLLCGGITVYSALRHAGMRGGQRIGVIGIGGLGHMAVQFAAALGNHVTAFTGSDDKAQFAAKLGAHDAVVTPYGEKMQPKGRKFDILISTLFADQDWSSYTEALDADGVLSFVGVPGKPLTIPITQLMFRRRYVTGSVTGGRQETQDMLHVADRHGVRPIVETFAFAQADEAIAKLRDNSIRYRAVLTR